MPRRDDRYDDDDDYDRPRRGGVGGGGSTVLYVLLGLGAAGILGCGVLGFLIVREVKEVAKDVEQAIEKAKLEMQVGPPVAAVSVAELGREYAGNVAAADAKYKNKSVRVEGVVEKIDGEDSYTVRLAPVPDDPTGMRVEAWFEEEHAAAVGELKVGQKVAVVGRCDGRQEDFDDADEDAPKPKRKKPKYVIHLFNCRVAGPTDVVQVDPAKPEPKDVPKPKDAKPAGTGPARENAPAPKKPNPDGDAP